MKLAICCPNASGHWNPSLALASELQSLGHEVCLAGFRDGEAKAEAAGVRLSVVAEDEYPPGKFTADVRELGRHTGFKALRLTSDLFKLEQLAYIRDLPRVCKAEQFDGMLVDQFSFGAATVAQTLGIPYVTIANALWFCRDMASPAGSSSLLPGRGLFSRLRCRLSHVPLQMVLKPWHASMNQKRKPLGLNNMTYTYWAESDLAIVSQQPEGFEFSETVRPDHLHFTGPFFHDETRESDSIDWSRFEGQPIIYVSMGTAWNRLMPVFRTIAAACVGLDAQVLIALGDRNATIGEDWPGTPIVVPHAPQLEVLKKASLVVTHAGLNTVLESLAHGVPMVAIPVAGDQPAVAARMARLGAGATLPLRQLREQRLRELIHKVLTDASFRESARRMQRTIAVEQGRQKAATIIECALSERRTITRDCV